MAPLLTVAGLSAGVIAGWNSISLALVISGIVLAALWFLFYSSFTPGFWGRRSTQTGTNALVATLSVIAIISLVNFLGVRYVQRVDLTENQLFTLAPQTQQVLRNLEQPIRAVVFIEPNNQIVPATRTLLERYQQLGNQFRYDFINPDAQPNLAQTFNVQSYGDMFLEVGDRKQFVQNINPADRLSESKLTNALLQVSNPTQSKVYFLQGHNEQPLEPLPQPNLTQAGFSQALAALTEKNFVAEPLNLVEQKTVPADASAVVVAGPRQALFEGEVKALSDYLDRGGSLMVLIDPNTKPQLDSLLKEWGVTLDDRVVVNNSEQQLVIRGQAIPTAAIINQYGEHPVTKDFGSNFSVFYFSRPVNAKPDKGVTVTPLLITGEQFWAESNLKESNLALNPETDQKGPLTLGFALSRPAEDKPQPSPSPSPSPNAETKESADQQNESRLIVIGNSAFASDSFFNQQLNSDLFLNSIGWLSKQDDQALSIRPKETKNRRISLTAQQASLVGWTAVGVLPVLGFGSAIYVWLRRR